MLMVKIRRMSEEGLMDASLPPIELPSPAYTENRDALYALIGEAFKLKAGQSTTGILRMPSKEDYGNHFVFGLRVHKAFP